MDIIYNKIKEEVFQWAEKGYICDYPEIQEIFEFIDNVSFLRKVQKEALQHYWYLRVVLGTPFIEDLYRNIFKGTDLLENLGIPSREIAGISNLSMEIQEKVVDEMIEKVKTDDEFVRRYRLEGLKETLTLNYPSYILSLAMGAGKTILIASIIAMEFALSLEYPKENFVKNALVFAPGKTILGALREISFTPYEKILPPRLYKTFITNVKFVYTTDGQKDIPVMKGSVYNVIVTNTEKIRLTKESIKKSHFDKSIRDMFESVRKEDDVKSLIANQRLHTITSLPSLAIFSDEAHHTYGQKIGEDLKRIRQTINYISDKTDLIVAINTTGTPYYKGKVLRDVIYWYGLSQGIKDGILKDVRGNIIAYEDVSDKKFIQDIIKDFIDNYWNISIDDGSKAKLAIYFPKIENISEIKPFIEEILIEKRINPNEVLLEVHNKSPNEIKDLFDNRINDPSVPYRIFLLVGKGTEGWNCPSLFACALARELKGSNNFCLQAATRCLRQIPFNKYKAKIYLSHKNVSLLDRQLRENYGENLSDINDKSSREYYDIKLTVRKITIPPVIIKKKILRVIMKDNVQELNKIVISPKSINSGKIKKTVYDLSNNKKGKVLRIVGEQEIETKEPFMDIYFLASDIADNYRLDYIKVLNLLKGYWKEDVIPISMAVEIKKSIENQISNYEIKEEIVEEALALLKLDGFNKDEEGKYYTEIRINKTRLEDLVLYWKDLENAVWGFHYVPYNFDSRPEKEFFENLLSILNENPDEIEDVYYTGAITSRDKTEFIFEYKDSEGNWHNYTPDFLIRKKDGKMVIVEVKGELYRDKSIEKIMKELQELNHDKIKYEIVETKKNGLKFGEMEKIKGLLTKENGG